MCLGWPIKVSKAQNYQNTQRPCKNISGPPKTCSRLVGRSLKAENYQNPHFKKR